MKIFNIKSVVNLWLNLLLAIFNEVIPSYDQFIRLFRNYFRDYFFLAWFHFFRNFNNLGFKKIARRRTKAKRSDYVDDRAPIK